MTETLETKSSLGGTALKTSLALGGAAALTLGSAFAAHALTVVDSGHVDIAAVQGAEIGSIFDDDGGFTAWDDPSFDYDQLDFRSQDTQYINCDAGVYTVELNGGLQPDAPFAGFANYGDANSDADFTIAKESTGTPGTGDVTFDTGSEAITTDPTGDNTLTVGPNGHVHGAWTLDSGTGACEGAGTEEYYDFDLNFDVVEVDGDLFDDHTFTFRVYS